MPAVIFDFDGTIADSFNSEIASAYKLTKKEQLNDIKHIAALRDEGVSLSEAIKRLNLAKWRWPWLLMRGRKTMGRDIHHVRLFPGMEDVFRLLRDEKYLMCIISSNSRRNIIHFLVEKDILSYFETIYGGAGFFDKSKLITKVLKNNHLKPESTLYVGDEVRDIAAAKETNTPCIAVGWGYNSAQLLTANHPLLVAQTPKQLGKIIIDWGEAL